jgi:hypothetical protein
VKGPKPPVVNLSADERHALEKLVRAHNTEQQIARRAGIILTASRGLNNEQVGRELQVGVDMVRPVATALAGWTSDPVDRTQCRGPSVRPAPGWQALGDHRRPDVSDCRASLRETGALRAPDQPLVEP